MLLLGGWAPSRLKNTPPHQERGAGRKASLAFCLERSYSLLVSSPFRHRMDSDHSFQSFHPFALTFQSSYDAGWIPTPCRGLQSGFQVPQFCHSKSKKASEKAPDFKTKNDISERVRIFAYPPALWPQFYAQTGRGSATRHPCAQIWVARRGCVHHHRLPALDTLIQPKIGQYRLPIF